MLDCPDFGHQFALQTLEASLPSSLPPSKLTGHYEEPEVLIKVMLTRNSFAVDCCDAPRCTPTATSHLTMRRKKSV